MSEYVLSFDAVGLGDLERVGGKNASIGELLRALTPLGVRVPRGFATTADAFREFLHQGGLDRRIKAELDVLDCADVTALSACGARIRGWILDTPFPPALRQAVLDGWRAMAAGRNIAVAVRSSATAEDLPSASFAGQQETFLNVQGEAALLRAVHEVYASLYNDRAIAYRVHQGFEHAQVALSVGVQHMVRSDLGASGVMFTLDTDSGFREVVFITSSYGLGETVVQGAVNPDEFYVYKPGLRAGRPSILRRSLGAKAIKMIYADAGSAERVRTVEVPGAERARFSLSDAEVQQLARQALLIEEHYGCPMDIEWARDGTDEQLYILQARPETVHSQLGRSLQRYILRDRSRVLVEGRSIGGRIGSGRARIVRAAPD
ncbi:MAG TPA: PEP/pyruvate-binding domain-containing protein, partial [Steroidobacteraceae bacterium]